MTIKILVVDDNQVSRELIREVLNSPDQVVLEAENVEEALEMILAERPDIVLLDIQIPAFDGFEVLRRLRSDPRFDNLPVIALSAYAMQRDYEKALKLGFDDYITKPIDISALRVRIEEILHTND